MQTGLPLEMDNIRPYNSDYFLGDFQSLNGVIHFSVT